MTPLDQKEKNTAANRVKGQHVRKFLLEWGKPPGEGSAYVDGIVNSRLIWELSRHY